MYAIITYFPEVIITFFLRAYQCLNLINMLLVENAHSLQEAIALLDPLPEGAVVLEGARATQMRYKYAKSGDFTLEEVGGGRVT